MPSVLSKINQSLHPTLSSCSELLQFLYYLAFRRRNKPIRATTNTSTTVYINLLLTLGIGLLLGVYYWFRKRWSFKSSRRTFSNQKSSSLPSTTSTNPLMPSTNKEDPTLVEKTIIQEPSLGQVSPPVLHQREFSSENPKRQEFASVFITTFIHQICTLCMNVFSKKNYKEKVPKALAISATCISVMILQSLVLRSRANW
ncbi:hypothetical protein FDP41_008883 [Naegleria fowleri]|uniref:Uncharacterized protein n=1 Tax=Naegleria fowleri TaxID=5763 RepID=A0A6A5BF41_NAEFO|nr:uncharacterized protein FDP41_008883 [Naegleria fowleri]KAF0972634.1 hypothetical protein FDP41_008883 [Naegleria fowleri]